MAVVVKHSHRQVLYSQPIGSSEVLDIAHIGLGDGLVACIIRLSACPEWCDDNTSGAKYLSPLRLVSPGLKHRGLEFLM